MPASVLVCAPFGHPSQVGDLDWSPLRRPAKCQCPAQLNASRPRSDSLRRDGPVAAASVPGGTRFKESGWPTPSELWCSMSGSRRVQCSRPRPSCRRSMSTYRRPETVRRRTVAGSPIASPAPAARPRSVLQMARRAKPAASSSAVPRAAAAVRLMEAARAGAVLAHSPAAVEEGGRFYGEQSILQFNSWRGQRSGAGTGTRCLLGP